MKNKEWIEKNRERLKKYQADYYLRNIEKLKEYKRNWYQSIKRGKNDKNISR